MMPVSSGWGVTDLTGGLSCPEWDSWDNLLLGQAVSACPCEDNSCPPLGPSLLTHHLPASSHFPLSPCKGPISVLSHSHTIPLSLFYYGLPPCLPLASLLTYPHWSAHVYLDRQLPYITCYPSTHGLIIALMMEAVLTSETSVNFNVATWRYIPEDSKLHTRCREYPKSHKHELFISKGRSQGTM
jgi:hypothetical protein